MSKGFKYTITPEQLAEFQKWSIKERLEWVAAVDAFLRAVQTREERIAAYRLRAGKNLKYYEENGFPEHI